MIQILLNFDLVSGLDRLLLFFVDFPSICYVLMVAHDVMVGMFNFYITYETRLHFLRVNFPNMKIKFILFEGFVSTQVTIKPF